jgi:hypothetical protein
VNTLTNVYRVIHLSISRADRPKNVINLRINLRIYPLYKCNVILGMFYNLKRFNINHMQQILLEINSQNDKSVTANFNISPLYQNFN